MTIKDALRKLDTLYVITGKDWVLTVHHILTEPTAPTVSIRPEGSNMMRYTVHRDTIEEGIIAAVDLVYREVVLGEKIVMENPWTNSDDHAQKGGDNESRN